MKNLLRPTTASDKKKEKKKFKTMSGKSMLNMGLLDKYSEAYINRDKELNDIEKVEIKLVELNEQHKQADEKMKGEIIKILDKYHLQHKKLVKENAEKEAKEKGLNRGTANKNTETYVENEMNQLVLEPPKIGMGQMAKNKKQPITLPRGIRTTNAVTPVHNKVENPYGKKSPVSAENSRTPKRKLPTTKDNDPSKTYKATLKGNNTPPMENRAKMSQNDTENEVRLRIQIRALTKGPKGAKTHNECLSDILYEFMQCAKEVDKEVSLRPWKKDSELRNLNGNELKLFRSDDIQEYIEIPDLGENLIDRKIYYQNGVRIKTKMTSYEFSESWSNKKYDASRANPQKFWWPIKPAEMQSSDESYPIGYFAGTTERGDYSTINDKISELAEVTAEVSFQFVNQEGVSPKIWRFAREQANCVDTNQQSKEHKRIKFSYAPSALVVYVSNKKDVKMARRNLIAKYGKLHGNHWPVMPDGSRMRFIPIVGQVKNKDVHQHLYDHLALQAVSKAGEVKLDLNMWDIHQKYDYLDGGTLEEIIHGLTSNNRQGCPIVKHIAKKWSRYPDQIDYEIVVAPSMLHEAQEMMKSIRAALVRKFGTKVQKHFVSVNDKWKTGPLANRILRDEYDPEIEDFIVDSTITDSYSQLLIEGISQNYSDQKMHTTDQAMLINEGHKDKGQEERTSNDTNELPFDSMSMLTGLTKNSISSKTAEWEEITIVNEMEDVIPVTEAQMNILKNTISDYNITTEEIENWKTTNENEYDKLITKFKKSEYQILSEIIRNVRKKRREIQEEHRESKNLRTLMELDKEKESPEMVLLKEVSTSSNSNHRNNLHSPSQTQSSASGGRGP